ncbi:MAG TPA: hypothetical protein GXX33_06530 [Firmicutes bacterium]|uniref:Uncharacterized protein n=1 Tax=Capillibacterium thermochitinicola TaxID=2699427 RepID=A0A8J6HYE5_9FIRM|nr:HisA/HisF-related TIM barrel protein [Capillibacterium thermochitinicola]MBA2132131.1 hypothetical protein [Capillibacterium thermochitinicola]HHW12640.1 hypothetical protein [Bacillota bacterium]
MLTKRLIACFDMQNGMVTKARQFQNNIPIAPAELVADWVYREQIDEIIFYDINASAERRSIDLETVKKVAGCVFVPFTVGGLSEDRRFGGDHQFHALFPVNAA